MSPVDVVNRPLTHSWASAGSETSIVVGIGDWAIAPISHQPSVNSDNTNQIRAIMNAKPQVAAQKNNISAQRQRLAGELAHHNVAGPFIPRIRWNRSLRRLR
jgi:hypothetical protein